MGGLDPDQLSAIDEMLLKLLSQDPSLTPDQLTPEMLASLCLPAPTDEMIASLDLPNPSDLAMESMNLSLSATAAASAPVPQAAVTPV